jgi:hypothetical protein
MKIQASDIKKFIIARCNERIKVCELMNSDLNKWEKARLLKYNMQNVCSPANICKYLIENRIAIEDIIVKSSTYSRAWTAYQHKLNSFVEMLEYAESYVSVGPMRKNIDCVIMRSAITC